MVLYPGRFFRSFVAAAIFIAIESLSPSLAADLTVYIEKQDTGVSSAKIEALNRFLAEAGGLPFDTIETQVASANQIESVVKEDCLFYPFDALHASGVSFMLSKEQIN